MKHETGGDPISGLKWTRKTTEKIAKELGKLHIEVSPNTVGRLLKSLGYSLRLNNKRLESGNKNPPKRRIRNQQFEYIAQIREAFEREGNPVISVDTKKKELIGNFKNGGQTWEKQPLSVYDHDFRSDAQALAVPFGIYDLQANSGYVCVGLSADTPAFAVDSIDHWWINEGAKRYPGARDLLILADCGGSNGARSRVWKYRIQKQLSDTHRLTVNVSHYPPGASKWNPIEHRLFSEISKNWAGRPLRNLQTMLNSIRTTTTSTGLQVRAHFVRRKYKKGVKIPEREMRTLSLLRKETLPDWNYSICPSKGELIVE
ncbi:hypothetical protein LCGC14_2723160 [marine sediment metagenome]|uniref:ISAzo13 family transposase n=1 Tax=marine sediment metagenome TaxID=412755 RepID=A0A0F8Z9N1_9ZZZZ